MHAMELFSLKGQTALVTGGARNLGREMAEALAEAGADLAITSRDAASAEKTAAALRQTTGRRVLALGMDVRDEASVQAGIERAVAELGRLDVLVANAGNVKNSAPLETRRREDWEETLATNATGVFFCVKHAAPYMMRAKRGSIVLIASIAGMAGKDRRHYLGTQLVGVTIDYVAAKGAVLAMTRDLAAYLGPHGIRVNAISPGGFERGQPAEFIRRYNEATMLGRMGRDGQDLKGAAVYLASDASAYVTGHNLVVDGGLTAW